MFVQKVVPLGQIPCHLWKDGHSVVRWSTMFVLDLNQSSRVSHLFLLVQKMVSFQKGSFWNSQELHWGNLSQVSAQVIDSIRRARGDRTGEQGVTG